MTDSFCTGSPKFADGDLALQQARDGTLAAWKSGFERFGAQILAHVSGDFAVALRSASGQTFLAVDRFGIRGLCYRIEGSQLDFAERADSLSMPSSTLDAQAVFDYLYFHVIPAPRTIFANVHRLRAGHYLLSDDGQLSVAPWWKPTFVENDHRPFPALRDEFRELLRESVARQVDDNTVGCFLSGGTDSSTVAGILGAVTAKPARTYSIGFDASGYDEMEYARLASRHFKTDHHEYYVTPDDLVRNIPAVAASYDQPFGNSSVLPAYCCAKMAREDGVSHLLAGDGGDELFGGNTRYAKQSVFSMYDHIPRSIRDGLIEPVLLRRPSLARIPGIKKAISYVEQARVPMPDRLQMYNLVVRLGLHTVLTPEFLATIDADAPSREQRAVYAEGNSRSLVNRMLAYDWKYTLADTDLPKVVGATSLAGVSVGFPLLDDRLVDFSLRLEPALKVRRLKLRWFFKEALRDFLPSEIIAKKKHGFGLPFGVWLNEHPGLRSLVFDSLTQLRVQRYIRADFLDRLTKEYLPQFPGYYGELIWVLLMLSQWQMAPRSRR